MVIESLILAATEYPVVMRADPITVLVAVVAIGATGYSYYAAKQAAKDAQRALNRNKGLNYTTRQPALTRRIVYGTARVGGVEVYIASTGSKNEYFHFILYWCEGPVSAIQEFQVNGDALSFDGAGLCNAGKYNGLIRVDHYTGAAGQTADATAVSELTDWTTDHIGIGCAYSYVRLQFDDKAFSNGVPNFSALIQGRSDIYDPRDTSTAFKTNPALCLSHYLSQSRVGPNVDYANELNEAQLIAAANVCDEQVALDAGGTEDRYKFDGVIDLGDDVETNILHFRKAMGGVVSYVGGEWYVFAGAYVVPTFVIIPQQLRGEVTTRNKSPRREHINTIRGTFIDPTAKYQPTSFPAVQNATYLSEDGEEMTREIDFPHTKSVAMVQRLAKIELERERLSREVTITTDITGIRAMPGKTVSFTFPRHGFNATPMDVLTWNISIDPSQGILCRMTLRETAASVFSWAAEENTFSQGSTPTIYDPTDVPDPANFTATPEASQFIDSDGNAFTSVALSWDDPSDIYVEQGQIRIRWKKTADPDYTNSKSVAGNSTSTTITQLEQATAYTFEIVFVSTLDEAQSTAVTTAGTTNTWDGTVANSPEVVGEEKYEDL